jgi:hypothetical protein
MRTKPILCVDFDGVVHSYTSGWKGATVIPDPPVPGALRWLWKATEWFDVKIYSSRSRESEAVVAMREWMVHYSLSEFGDGHPMSEYPGEPPGRPYPDRLRNGEARGVSDDRRPRDLLRRALG